MDARAEVAGVVLAGGRARRMGGVDKSLLLLDDQSILDHVVARSRVQVSRLLINTNSKAPQFHSYGLTLVKDSVDGYVGPLAGVLAGMEWLQSTGGDDNGRQWLASFPADSPFFPDDLVNKLLTAAIAVGADIACATHDGQRSPLFTLWSTGVSEDLHRQLERRQRRVTSFQQRHHCVVVPFDSEPYDPFFNINTLDDLAAARALAAHQGSAAARS